MTNQSPFILDVLRDLQSRTEAAVKRFPGLRHMLVLSPGESIRIPQRIGCRSLGSSNREQRLATCRFGKTKLVGPLPPRTSWPKGIKPLGALSRSKIFYRIARTRKSLIAFTCSSAAAPERSRIYKRWPTIWTAYAMM